MSLHQEKYLLEDVLPLVEGSYPVETGPDGRLLVGFSKSGWGAWSLLLRHPGVFGKAAAWDAPLMQDAPDRFGMSAQCEKFPWRAKENVPHRLEVLKPFSLVFAAPACIA